MPAFNDPHLIPRLLYAAQRFPTSEADRLVSTFQRHLTGMSSKAEPSPLDAASMAFSALITCMESVQRDLASEALEADERSNAWLTVSEILDRKIPGLPTGRAKLVAYLDAHGLTTDPLACRKRAHTSRALEYHRSALTRAAIRKRGNVPARQVTDGEVLAAWVKGMRAEQPDITASGCRLAYIQFLQDQRSADAPPSLRDFQQAIQAALKGGR